MGIDFTGITLGFSAQDVLSSAVGFIGVFTGFILLGLAVKFAPNIVNFLMGLFRSRSRY
ncbi:MAG: hypothetical protein IMW85_00905 [Thermicanus sp.]|nr:hypothetical protein [Thermicanus sp.]